MAHILIAGCGDVGTTLGLLLAAQGHVVWGLRRDPAPLPTPIRAIAADLGDPVTLEHLPPELDYVFYTAAAGARDEAHYRAVYVEGIGHLLDALAGQPLRRVFLTSSTSVYAQDDGGWVDEDSPAAGQGTSGRLIREGEQRLLAGPFPATVVRFAGIYGPGRTRLLEQVRAGRPCQAEPPQWSNRIHRDDCARVLAHLLTLEQPAPLYLAVDDEPAPLHEVLAWLAQRLELPAPPIVNPPLPAGQNKRCRNARLRATGFVFRYPSYREGYGAMLAR
ncbi:MAG TPA: SDR family oxidoreductase [Candidatus Competibacteraceae bacterium]|nr:SDR family oxidoreductase [Candidatus Competibacteraceae bacterium]